MALALQFCKMSIQKLIPYHANKSSWIDSATSFALQKSSGIADR